MSARYAVRKLGVFLLLPELRYLRFPVHFWEGVQSMGRPPWRFGVGEGMESPPIRNNYIYKEPGCHNPTAIIESTNVRNPRYGSTERVSGRKAPRDVM